VQTLQLLLGDYNLDLNKQLCFIIDSLLNVCDWQECTTGGTTYGKGDYVRAMDSPRGSIIYAAPCMVCGSAVDRPFLGATTYDRPEGVTPRN